MIVIVGWHRQQSAGYACLEAWKGWEEHFAGPDGKSWSRSQRWLRVGAAGVGVGCDKRVCNFEKGSERDDETAARYGDGFALPDETNDTNVQYAEAANWSQEPSASH